MAEEFHDHRQLKVWQMSVEFAVECYRLTADFPSSELYGLTSQIRRAAVSVPANIAEGHGRDSTKEYLRCVSIAIGSAAELQTLFELARRIGLSEPWLMDDGFAKAEEIGRMLRGLQKALKRRLRSK